mgnify:CR=1 FL=1
MRLLLGGPRKLITAKPQKGWPIVNEALLHIAPGPPVREVVARSDTESVLVRRAGQDNELAYSPERKAAVLAKMLPPHSMPLGQLAKEEGISVATLAKWRGRREQRAGSFPMRIPGSRAGPPRTSWRR